MYVYQQHAVLATGDLNQTCQFRGIAVDPLYLGQELSIRNSGSLCISVVLDLRIALYLLMYASAVNTDILATRRYNRA